MFRIEADGLGGIGDGAVILALVVVGHGAVVVGSREIAPLPSAGANLSGAGSYRLIWIRTAAAEPRVLGKIRGGRSRNDADEDEDEKGGNDRHMAHCLPPGRAKPGVLRYSRSPL